MDFRIHMLTGSQTALKDAGRGQGLPSYPHVDEFDASRFDRVATRSASDHDVILFRMRTGRRPLSGVWSGSCAVERSAGRRRQRRRSPRRRRAQSRRCPGSWRPRWPASARAPPGRRGSRPGEPLAPAPPVGPACLVSALPALICKAPLSPTQADPRLIHRVISAAPLSSLCASGSRRSDRRRFSRRPSVFDSLRAARLAAQEQGARAQPLQRLGVVPGPRPGRCRRPEPRAARLAGAGERPRGRPSRLALGRGAVRLLQVNSRPRVRVVQHLA